MYCICNQGEEKGQNITKLGSKGISGLSFSSSLAWQGESNSPLTLTKLEFSPWSMKYHSFYLSQLQCMINSGSAITWLTWNDFALLLAPPGLGRWTGANDCVSSFWKDQVAELLETAYSLSLFLIRSFHFFFCFFLEEARVSIEASGKWLNFNGI